MNKIFFLITSLVLFFCNINAQSQSRQLSDFFVSVKDFGAKGDARSDDSKAFQAALDYCEKKSKKILLIPDGNYFLKRPLSIKRGGVQIMGTGALLREESWLTSIDRSFKDSKPFDNCSIIVPKDGVAFVYERTVGDPVRIVDLQFKSENGRTVGNTTAILFKSEFTGPTWPFIIERCNFRGFNFAVKFSSSVQYNVAFVQILNNAFSQNDECIFFDNIPLDKVTNLGERNLAWGFQFSNNHCHDNSRIIRGTFAKDAVNILNNNMEGNISYANGKTPENIVDIEVSNATVNFEGNHFEGILSDAVCISSFFKKKGGGYYGISGTTSGSTANRLFIKGNNFDGVSPSYRHFVLKGLTIFNYDEVKLYLDGCDIRLNEANYNNTYLTQEGKYNGATLRIAKTNLSKANSFIPIGYSKKEVFLKNKNKKLKTNYILIDKIPLEFEDMSDYMTFSNEVKFLCSSFLIRNYEGSGFFGADISYEILYSVADVEKRKTITITGGYGLKLGENYLVSYVPKPTDIPKSASKLRFKVKIENGTNYLGERKIDLFNSVLLYTSNSDNPIFTSLSI